MLKIFKKISFWDRLPLDKREKIKTLFGLYAFKIINPKNIEISNVGVSIFFADELNKIYQIEQWLDFFAFLDTHKKLLFIVKDRKVFNWLKETTDFVVVYYQNLEHLTQFYTKSNIKVVLYANNGLRNFHSLMNSRSLHVYINHGDSDKTSTISNQVKAYDYSFVVGDAAYDKYRLNLLKKDMTKFVKVGRPQLDFIETIDLSLETTDNKKIILYAPTWEGNYSAMNFSSLKKYGLNIVQKLLAHSDYFLLYKPHPTTGMRDREFKKINSKIINIIKNSNRGEVILHKDINSLYGIVDVAIFDNSAVAIDYLYINKPMLMTDMFFNMQGRISEPIISRASILLSETNIDKLCMIIEEELSSDTMKEQRNKIKKYFLGDYDYTKKESSKKFVSEIDRICEERDMLLEKLKNENRI